MRILLLLIMIQFTTTKLVAQPTILSTQNIDQMDTVVFDLSKALLNGSSISFPVSIISDDTISALDFSFKYDHTNILYDSIIDLTGYLQSISFYNPNDSTVRFTSYSLVPVSKDTDLVTVQMTLLATQISPAFFNTVKAYLNGSTCSIKINQVSTSINEDFNINNRIELFPNPASSSFQLNFEFEQERFVTATIYDLQGQFVSSLLNQKVNESNFSFNTDDLITGIYLVKLELDKSEIQYKKLSVVH